MKFYIITTSEGYAKAYYDLQKSKEYVCEKCEAVYLSERIADYRVHFEGKKLGDFYRAPGCYIGNEKFLAMLKKYEITGYEIRGIDCTGWYDNRKSPIDVDSSNLKEIVILGKCGCMCDLEGKEIEKCDECDEVDFWVKKAIRGLSVPLNSWDGSDIFQYKNWNGVMICSERLKEACEEEKIKNVSFKPVEEMTF